MHIVFRHRRRYCSSLISIPAKSYEKTWSVKMPLLSIPGVQDISLHKSETSVDALSRAIKSIDDTVTNVSVTNSDGVPYAVSTPVSILPSLYIGITDNTTSLKFKIETGPNPEASVDDDSLDFHRFSQSLKQRTTRSLTREEFIKDATLNYNAKDTNVALTWLRALERRRILYNVNNTLVLAHSVPTDSTKKALDIQNTLVTTLRREKESELRALEAQLSKALAIEAEITKKAEKLLLKYKWLVFLGLNAQFGGMAYLVWDVLSWDVVEPLTYFMGLSAAIGVSLYHSMTRKDFSLTNLWDRMKDRRITALRGKKHHNDVFKMRNSIEELRLHLAILQNHS